MSHASAAANPLGWFERSLTPSDVTGVYSFGDRAAAAAEQHSGQGARRILNKSLVLVRPESSFGGVHFGEMRSMEFRGPIYCVSSAGPAF